MNRVTCERCGKVLIIRRDGDGIHTCTPAKEWWESEAGKLELENRKESRNIS